MKNPFKQRDKTKVPGVVDACEQAKRKANAELIAAIASLGKASRAWISQESPETKQALDEAQAVVDQKRKLVAQCELAIEDARIEHADAIRAAEAEKTDEAWERISTHFRPQMEEKAKKLKSHLDAAVTELFELAELGNEATALAPDLDVPVHDSLLNNMRIVGYFRQHLRKRGGEGTAMSWAFPWFDNPADIPDFDESVSDALAWLTKCAPQKHQVQTPTPKANK